MLQNHTDEQCFKAQRDSTQSLGLGLTLLGVLASELPSAITGLPLQRHLKTS